MWSADWCEGAATGFRAAARALGALRPANDNGVTELEAMLGALRIKPARKAGSGCRGNLQVSDRKVRWDRRGSPQLALRHLTHESGHLAALMRDEEYPHDERGADLIGLAIVYPRERVRAVLDEVPLTEPAEIAKRLPELAPHWALLRAVWVADEPAIIHGPEGRMVWLPDSRTMRELDADEATLVRDVRVHGKPQRELFGVEAFPVSERGVLLLSRTK